MRIALLVLSAGLLGACSSGPAADDRVIEIGIEHSAFDPVRIEVEEGESVTFVVENGDPIDHEFILGDDEVQQMHEEGMDKRHDGPGQISVPAGESREITYTFEEAGMLIYGCHVPGHYDYGMRGAVEVE